MFDSTTSALTWSLGCLVILYTGRRTLRSRSSYPLPPGPPGIPWVGNVIGIDKAAPWVTYAEWGKKYGDIVYTRLFGKEIIIINSEQVARDILENRSKIYSGRPALATSDMSGLGFNTALLPYGDEWRLHRRFFHQTFGPEAVSRFIPMQHRKTCQLLQRLLDTPEKLNDHLFEFTTSIILNSVYDYDPTSRKDSLVDMMANLLHIVIPLMRPDIAIIAGTFPFLLNLPSWFPGMGFKRDMATARAFSKEYLEQPFAYALRKHDKPSGSCTPTLVNDALRGMEEKDISPDQAWMKSLKEASGTAFFEKQSYSVLMTFFLMVLVNPEVQKLAHTRIDAVTDGTRLPALEDRPLLPFIDAILWEILRYSPVVPLSVPHVVVRDDVYNGFHIPKDAIIMPNVWSMGHDPSKYPNPHTFYPMRFLNDDGTLKPKPTEIDHIAFGFGRRMCIGRHFADTSVWMAIATILAMFDVLPPLDERGVETPVEVRFSSGIAVQPQPFRCRIVSRVEGMDAERLEEWIAASMI